MMDQRGGDHEQLFYAFNLDNHVPKGHLLRRIDDFFDSGDLRKHMASFYSHTGRPSIDPDLMIRMLNGDGAMAASCVSPPHPS